MQSQRLGIIAGAGRFPFYVAQEAKKIGIPVAVAGLKGWADASLFAGADAFCELPVGRFADLIAWFKQHEVTGAVMAGKVTKEVLFSGSEEFDDSLKAVLATAGDSSVNALLGAVAQGLQDQGIAVLDSSSLLKDNLAPAGLITAREPSDVEQQDIQVGLKAARLMAELDVGQTVVVRQGVVVAVEALEGTDATIKRAGRLVGDGLVVVKTASPTQDRRFDLPCIGPDTLQVFRESGVKCLAVEAGSTLLLDRERLLEQAEADGLCIWGVNLSGAAE